MPTCSRRVVSCSSPWSARGRGLVAANGAIRLDEVAGDLEGGCPHLVEELTQARRVAAADDAAQILGC